MIFARETPFCMGGGRTETTDALGAGRGTGRTRSCERRALALSPSRGSSLDVGRGANAHLRGLGGYVRV
jgi:hypothetical protein